MFCVIGNTPRKEISNARENKTSAMILAEGMAKAGVLQVRVDDLERQGFTEAAGIAGLTRSAWVRERLRQICKQELEQNKRPVPFPAFPSGKKPG